VCRSQLLWRDSDLRQCPLSRWFQGHKRPAAAVRCITCEEIAVSSQVCRSFPFSDFLKSFLAKTIAGGSGAGFQHSPAPHQSAESRRGACGPLAWIPRNGAGSHKSTLGFCLRRIDANRPARLTGRWPVAISTIALASWGSRGCASRDYRRGGVWGVSRPFALRQSHLPGPSQSEATQSLPDVPHGDQAILHFCRDHRSR
jgi:hypothetical protein